MEDYTQYNEYTRSGSEAVKHFLNEEPLLGFKALKEKLRKANVKLEDQTIRNYMSKWRLYSRNEVVSRLQHFGFGRLDSGFPAELWEVAPSYGWVVGKNRNRRRFRRKSGITLSWDRNGTVLFRFKGYRLEADLLSAFSHSFWHVILSTGRPESETADYLRALFKERYREGPHHEVYETGQLLPKKTIVDPALGEKIKLGDYTHPTALERELHRPWWVKDLVGGVDKLNEAAEKLSEGTEKLNQAVERIDGSLRENYRSHIELVDKLTKESEKRQEAFEQITSLLTVQDFDDCIRKVKQIVLPYWGWCARCGQNRVLFFSLYSVDSQGRDSSGAICRDCVRVLREKAPPRLRKILSGPIAQRRLKKARLHERLS
jgi:hypothetical protein